MVRDPFSRLRSGRCDAAVLVAVALVLAARPSTAGIGEWTSHGPDGGPVLDLEWDGAAPSTVFVATRFNGVFRSGDSGTTWVAANVGLPREVSALAGSPNGTLFAIGGGNDTGAFVSADGGASWLEVLDVVPTAIATDPTAGGVVYVGTGEPEVFKSVDGGANWTSSAAGLGQTGIKALVVDPLAPSTLYLGTTDSGVYKSTDGGLSWVPKGTGIPSAGIDSLVIDPVDSSRLYAATTDGLYRTVDGADTWIRLVAGPTFVTALAIDRLDPANLMAASFGQVFYSSDSGITWTQLTGGIPAAEIHAVRFAPTTAGLLFAGTGSGVARSDDGGASWSEPNSGLRALRVEHLALDPVTPGTLYAASSDSGIFKSLDAGASWMPVQSGLSNRLIQDLELATGQPQTLFAGQLLGLRKTTDGGAGWADPVTDPEDFGGQGPIPAALALDPQNSDRVFFSNQGYRGASGGKRVILRSIDGGVSWDTVFEPSGFWSLTMRDVMVDAFDSNVILMSVSGTLVGTNEQQIVVFRSSDGGGTWSQVHAQEGSGFSSLISDPVVAGRQYALSSPGYSFQLVRSTDSGVGWTPWMPPLACVQDLLPDPSVAGRIWAGCDGLSSSEDFGATWTPFDDTGFPGGVGGILTIAITQDVPPTLHVGTEIGVYSYTLPIPGDLAISKDDGVSELDPGSSLTYSIVVSNVGSAPAVGARVIDSLPAALSCTWSCTPAGGGVCNAAPPAGDLDEVVDLPIGASATFTGSCIVDSGASGFLANTASVLVPAGMVDERLSDNSATDIDAVLTMGACGAFEDRFLSDVVLSSPQTIEACSSILTGQNVSIAADVIFRAPFLGIGSGFVVESGTFTAVNQQPLP